MASRTLVVAAGNLLARGFLVVPTERRDASGRPAGALFAVARAVTRALAFRRPDRALAVVGPAPAAEPALLAEQRPALAALCAALGLHVVHAEDELRRAAAYVRAAQAAGDDVLVVGVDKRLAQLVGERVAWYDANKDVRYTPEIVKKRFQVAPERVADWLALVGDEDQLPGVAGIGAKGATGLLEAHGAVEAALAAQPPLEGRLGKALEAARASLPALLAAARLEPADVTDGLPDCAFTPPAPAELNRRWEALAFAELLVADASTAASAELCEEPDALARTLAALGDGPLGVCALEGDPAPLEPPLAGIAVARADGLAAWVPAESAAWPALLDWLEDASKPKIVHDLVELEDALVRAGRGLRGVVGDAACASHLTQPSGWAPHDLPLVAKHALGVALPDDDAIRGVGRARKAWSQLAPGRAGAVAGERAQVTTRLWDKLAPALDPALLEEYLALSRVLVRMQRRGIGVDEAELGRAEVEWDALAAELEEQIAGLAGRRFNINSTKQLGDVLFAELGLPIVSRTKTGWSTATEALERIAHAHPIVALVIEWRSLRRLRDSWIVALRKAIDVDGRVHAHFHPARSFSGTLIASRPDLGRVPGRTARMARIRRAFVAPPGRLLVSIDFRQLGLYVLAHLTKDPALVEPLRARADLHRLTAAAVLEKAPEDVSYEERQLGKVVNFATFAGQGASALGLELGLSPEQARAYKERFDRRYAGVRAFQDAQLAAVQERGEIVTLAGRKWPIGGLSSLDPMLRSYAERLARRATHEGSVADVSRRALLRAAEVLAREGLDAEPLLQIHDEVLFEVAESQLEVAARACAEAMRRAFALEVPLVVGVEAGRNWADLAPVPGLSDP